jgi:glutamate--cysteine ligase catalytic subunit
VRFKPPPSLKSGIGWRVEFRTTEIQPTADENAILTIFLTYFIKIIEEDDDSPVNFYIPVSYSDRNFERARQMDAITQQKFFFRTNIEDKGRPVIEEMTLHEIMFGKGNFKGLFEVISRKIERRSFTSLQDDRLMKTLNNVRDYLEDKLSGKLLTLARWMRNFVLAHPEYKHDSVISENISNDLLKRLVSIEKG